MKIRPLAEQHRIVVKVDKLMALCDTLKARLKDAQDAKSNWQMQSLGGQWYSSHD